VNVEVLPTLVHNLIIIKVQQYQFDILIVSLTFLNMYLLVAWKKMNKQSIHAPIGSLSNNKTLNEKRKINKKLIEA
jgi:hypothetical protein